VSCVLKYEARANLKFLALATWYRAGYIENSFQKDVYWRRWLKEASVEVFKNMKEEFKTVDIPEHDAAAEDQSKKSLTLGPFRHNVLSRH
jgi:hypothetical protein